MYSKEEKNRKQREYYAKRKAGLGSSNPGRPANTPEVLWSKVDKRGDDECWPWLGFKNQDGYGRTWINDYGYFAHRIIYSLEYPGVIEWSAPKNTEESGFLLHTCDNPICCNPKHLFVGTLLDNMRDKVAKGRTPDFSGDKGPRCKLSIDQAREARKLRKEGASVKSLANKFGLSLPSMKTLLRGESYRE